MSLNRIPEEEVAAAREFWDTHCGDCGHDLHPMNVCSTVVGGDQNGPDYCPCAVDYPALAAEYQRLRPRLVEAVTVAIVGLPNSGGVTWNEAHDVAAKVARMVIDR